MGALAIGAVVPGLVSVVLVGAGFWVRRSRLCGQATRVAGWTVVGATVGGILATGAILYLLAHGVEMVDARYIVVNMATFGALAGLVVGWYDASQKRYASQLRDRTDQLERERDRLEELMGVISHDLRNPLTVAKGYLDLLEGGDQEARDRIEEALERMDQIIEDVMAIAREGQHVEETDSVDLTEMAETCWRHVDTRGAELQVSGDLTFEADRGRLSHLLENLFRNAVDHGDSEVTVHVGSLQNGFYVEDDGPGIPPDERNRVFESGYSTRDEGTGLGLSIVQRVAKAHGWSIRVTNGTEDGARFEITGVETHVT